jgi:putative hydrolase of the HAD superfamily
VAELVGIYRRHEPRLRLPRGSRSLLEGLRGSWRLGILTNGLPSVQRAKVKALGVEMLVDAVVYAEEHGAGSGKPDPQAFVEVLARLETPADRAVIVGDDPACDVTGGRRLGMRTVWLERGRRGGVPGPSADAIVGSLDEVPAALEALGIPEGQHAH